MLPNKMLNRTEKVPDILTVPLYRDKFSDCVFEHTFVSTEANPCPRDGFWYAAGHAALSSWLPKQPFRFASVDEYRASNASDPRVATNELGETAGQPDGLLRQDVNENHANNARTATYENRKRAKAQRDADPTTTLAAGGCETVK